MDVKAAIENTKYYLNKNGKMQTGWQKIGGKWYYMDKNGALQESIARPENNAKKAVLQGANYKERI